MRLLPRRPPSADAAPAVTDVPGAATTAPAPSDERGPRLQRGIRSVAITSLELLVIVVALYVLGEIIGKLWVVILPVVIGLLVTTVLWPPTRFLRRHGWPPALAAAVVLLGAIAVFGGIIAIIAPQVVDQVETLADQVTGGLRDIQDYLEGPPFNIDPAQIDDVIDNASGELQSRAGDIAGYAATGATAIGNVLINLVLALVLCFFFLKDGPRWVPWLAAQTGRKAAPHVAALSDKAWSTLSEFIRQQAFVGFIDALFIGIGLWVLDVPLVLPLAVITFFAAFVPIIGAVVAGAFAVLIALVDQGFGTALAVLIIVLVVQQIEGNVLQPIIQGRGFNLHAGVVILAVTAGSSLAGITGAFLGVPVAALIAVTYRYVRDQLDGKSPEVTDDGNRTQIVGDETGVTLAAESVDAPGDRGPGPEEDAGE
jgi:predicted PurR-regulated permease PerM